ncbi:hypothetical protein LQW54_002047 [Pestalotiopsis sp. IQ-011]
MHASRSMGFGHFEQSSRTVLVLNKLSHADSDGDLDNDGNFNRPDRRGHKYRLNRDFDSSGASYHEYCHHGDFDDYCEHRDHNFDWCIIICNSLHNKLCDKHQLDDCDCVGNHDIDRNRNRDLYHHYKVSDAGQAL